MRVLLINPPISEIMETKDFYIPSSLLYLASSLQSNGIEVRILDLNIYKPWEDQYHTIEDVCDPIVTSEISAFNPTLVGIGCLFSGHISIVLHFSELIKRLSSDIWIVIGGIHPTLYPTEILLNWPHIDWVVIGEGEVSLVQLVNNLKEGTDNFEQIDGFAYRKHGRVVVNQKTSFISDLCAHPFPAFDLINLEDYYLDTSHWHNPRNLPINVSVPIISSRACPLKCTFCSMFTVMGRTWRDRSAANVVDEIEYLYHTYNQRHFSFFDDQLTLNKRRTIGIANEIVKRNLYLQIESQNGVMVKTLDKEVLDALVSAGLVRIALAIESGSDHIRNSIMGKKLSKDKIYEVVQLTKEYKDLFVKAFFIMGMAEDTHETLTDTYNMIREIDVDRPHVVNIMPFPGTKVFEQAVRDTLFVNNFDLDNLWKFTGFYGTGNKQFFIKPYKLSLEDLAEWRKKFDGLVDTLMLNKSVERRQLVEQ